MKQTAHLIWLLLLSFVITTTVVGQNQKRELGNNESIKSGQMLFSQSGLLKMQVQNNSLVVIKDGTIIWQSKNWSLGSNKFKIDKLAFENGNINCYFQNKLTWSSRTSFLNSKLILGDDGIMKIISIDNKVLWENFAGTANSVKPPLVCSGDEGPFTDITMHPTDKIKLYALFVDWPDAKATTNKFDSLWNRRTSNGELFSSLKQQGRAINLQVESHLSKKWQTLPNPTSFYFPPTSEDGVWNWEEYIKDCPAFLPSAFGLDSFSENSIVVIIPNPSIGDKWKKGVPTGNLPINFHGIKYLINMHPNETNNYRTMMHEIGHCYGSGELYPIINDIAQSEIFGIDMMGDSHFATGFMGYHRYRYGWMPFNKSNPKSIYLTQKHSYGVTLTPLSANNGISMVLIPDETVTNDSLNTPHKLWGIEIAQDVQSPEQYFAGKNEKILKEGEAIIIYSVDSQEQPGKRAIRLISKTGKLPQADERWSKVFLYKDGETFQNTSAPMDVKIYRNADGSFYLDIQIKN
jgi:hypothetical protein